MDSLTPEQTSRVQSIYRTHFRRRNRLRARVLDNMQLLIESNATAHKCAEEIMFIYEAARIFIDPDILPRVDWLLQFVNSASDLKRALHAIFLAALHGMCTDPNMAPDIANESEVNSLGESEKQHRYREIQVITDAIREAYSANYQLNFGSSLTSQLLPAQLDITEAALTQIFSFNCNILYRAIRHLGFNGITLNGACELKTTSDSPASADIEYRESPSDPDDENFMFSMLRDRQRSQNPRKSVWSDDAL